MPPARGGATTSATTSKKRPSIAGKKSTAGRVATRLATTSATKAKTRPRIDTEDLDGAPRTKRRVELFENNDDEASDEDASDNPDRGLTHEGEVLDESDEEDDHEQESSDSASSDAADDSKAASKDQDSSDNSVEGEAPSEVAERIRLTVAALADTETVRARTERLGESRGSLVARLARDCAVYYGYLPELVDMFLTLFGPSEMVELLEANETQRPTVIRANTLKTSRRALAQALTARGVGLEPVAAWTNLGLKVFDGGNSGVPLGATPEYLAGHYMLQSASSLTPVMALEPRPGERVLDMCASPGGKTTHIAQLMKNEGVIVANDAKKPRIAALVANLARLGVRNAVCVNYDGREFPKVMGGFDRVLLDAPCSGLGVVSHDPSVKQMRTLKDIMQNAHLQKQLLLAAIDACKSPSGAASSSVTASLTSTSVPDSCGVIVYSTCSISVQENEQVIQYALERRNVRIVESGLEIGRPGLERWQGYTFHPTLRLARRLFPHVHNMDGFFICKLVKLGPTGQSGGELPDPETPQGSPLAPKAATKPKSSTRPSSSHRAR